MAKIIRTILSVVIQNTESLHENTDFKSNENQKPESFRNFVVRSIKNDENILIKHRNRYRVRRHARRRNSASAGQRDWSFTGQTDAPHAAYIQLLRDFSERRKELRPDLRPPAIRLPERLGGLSGTRTSDRHRRYGRNVPAARLCAVLSSRPAVSVISTVFSNPTEISRSSGKCTIT